MYERNRRFAESEALLLDGVKTLGLDRLGDDARSGALRAQGAAVNVVAQIAHLYDAWSRPDKAAEPLN